MDREEELATEVAAPWPRWLLGALVPAAHNGCPLNPLEFVFLTRARSRLFVDAKSVPRHSMVCAAVARWAVMEQRQKWLPRLASGFGHRGVCAHRA